MSIIGKVVGAIIGYLMGAILGITAVFAWFVILFTGRFPEGLYKPMRAASAWQVKATAYFLLVSEDFPPFWVDEEEEAPRFGGAGSVPALEADPYGVPAAPDPYAPPQVDQGQAPPHRPRPRL